MPEATEITVEAESGDCVAVDVRSNTGMTGACQCPDCRLRCDTERGQELQWRFFHDPSRYREELAAPSGAPSGRFSEEPAALAAEVGPAPEPRESSDEARERSEPPQTCTEASDALDADRDGTVCRAEFAAWCGEEAAGLVAPGPPPAQAGAPPAEAVGVSAPCDSASAPLNSRQVVTSARDSEQTVTARLVSREDRHYRIEVERAGSARKRSVRRRYREFLELDRQLRPKFPMLPTLPERSFWRKNFRPSFLSTRERELRGYFAALSEADPFASDPALRDFLQLSPRRRGPMAELGIQG